VCGCFLRTQQGVCDASAKVGFFPSGQLFGWLGFLVTFLLPGFFFFRFLLESLILAQDERWRRA
jgi:hypothetical protein